MGFSYARLQDDNAWKPRIKNLKTIGVVVFSVSLLIFLFLINVSLLGDRNDNYSFSEKLKHLITVLFFNVKKDSTKEKVENLLGVAPIQRGIWICMASMVGAIAMVISGSTIQSLTQNPLADTTTLGFISSTIFGIVFMKGIISGMIETSNYHFLYFLFALMGGLISLFILSFLFRKSYNKTQHLKIILIGLVLNMIFKTFTHLVKAYNSNSVNTSYALALGGAENIYQLYSNQFDFLKWCSIGIAVIFAITLICSQKLNLFELGEDQAKTLGVNVKSFKHFGYLITLLTSTIAITLIGNVTFLGLICTHSIRNWFKTRKYQVIIPLASLMSCVIIMFGILLNSICPYISSSMFILLLGGVMLLTLTLKNKEL